MFVLSATAAAAHSPDEHAGETGSHGRPKGEAGALPPRATSSSLYESDERWRDERGAVLSLADFSGEPVLLTLFYTSCHTHVCSVAVENLLQVERELRQGASPAPSEVLLITLDSDFDDPTRLHRYKRGYRLTPNWHLLVGSGSATRKLTQKLGYPWEEGDPSEIIHAYAIYLIDGTGRVAQIFSWESTPGEIAAALVKLRGRGGIEPDVDTAEDRTAGAAR